MMRSIFGWDLPPGVSLRDIDPPEAPCEVCGNDAAACICPECPVCHYNGDPACYVDLDCRHCGAAAGTPCKLDHCMTHGLTRTPAQLEAWRVNEAAWAEQARQDAAAEADARAWWEDER